jgi:hypothetical protein
MHSIALSLPIILVIFDAENIDDIRAVAIMSVIYIGGIVAVVP